jgi:hypothetical protein
MPSFRQTGAPLPLAGGGGSPDATNPDWVRDGRLNSAWFTTSSREPASAYVYVDLGAVRPVTGVRWVFSRTGWADAVAIGLSSDATAWTNVAEVGNATALAWQELSLSGSARYVRFFFTNPNGDARLGYLAEVEVWGEPSPATTATPVPPTVAPPDPTSTPLPPTNTPAPPTATPTTAPVASPVASPVAPTATPPTAGVPTGATLMGWYDINPASGVPEYEKTKYQPGAFATGFAYTDPTWGTTTVEDAGSYAGWDFHPTLNYASQRYQSTSNWFTFGLNRDATVAVVWRGGSTVPAWLAGWEPAGSVKATWTYPSGTVVHPTLQVYHKTFAAGEVALGGVNDPGVSTSRDTYWVLLAEADSRPSSPPAVPSGYEVPVPGATCPAWLHDTHTTTGPDGQTYPTWHPLIDPVYWCSYRHEHGTDPSHFDPAWEPAFGVASTAMGMTEPHAGFKVYVFDHNGYRWAIVHHFGTAGLGRLCQRHHEFQLAIKDLATGQILADLHFVADYGTATPTDQPTVRYTPPDCPAQGDSSIGGAKRMIPYPDSGTGTGYEPWTFAAPLPVLGLSGALTINTRDPIVVCNRVPECDAPFVTGNSGSTRFVSPANGFGWTDPGHGASFCTDPMGRAVVTCGPGTVRQTVVPGANASLGFVPAGFNCVDTGWGRPYVCGADLFSFVPVNYEDALQTGVDAQGRPTYGPN